MFSWTAGRNSRAALWRPYTLSQKYELGDIYLHIFILPHFGIFYETLF